MSKCPFCQGEQLQFLSSSPIVKNYSKIEHQKSGMYSSTKHHMWTQSYCIKKYICLKCGMVNEQLDEQQLAEMLKNQEYES